jgi:hypothetical protein
MVGDSWAKKLKEELENIGLAHIWQGKFVKNEWGKVFYVFYVEK